MDRNRFKSLYRLARCRSRQQDKYGAPLCTAEDGINFWFATHVPRHRGPWVSWGDRLDRIHAFTVLGRGRYEREPALRRAFLSSSRRQPPVPLP